MTSESGEKEGKLQLAKDSLDKMLNDVYPIRGKVSNAVSNDSLDKCRALADIFSLLQFNVFCRLAVSNIMMFCFMQPVNRIIFLFCICYFVSLLTRVSQYMCSGLPEFTCQTKLVNFVQLMVPHYSFYILPPSQNSCLKFV